MRFQNRFRNPSIVVDFRFSRNTLVTIACIISELILCLTSFPSKDEQTSLQLPIRPLQAIDRNKAPHRHKHLLHLRPGRVSDKPQGYLFRVTQFSIPALHFQKHLSQSIPCPVKGGTGLLKADLVESIMFSSAIIGKWWVSERNMYE